MKSVDQILITGTFRSGTTLIAQLLRNHPDVELVYDSVNFMRFSFGRYDPIDNFKNVKLLIKEIKDRIAERWDMHFNYDKVISQLEGKTQSYSLIYDTFMRELLLKDSSAKIWGEKTTLVWTKIPDFLQMFPNGGVIHIIRDPRAIVSSWRKMTNAPGYDYLDAIFNCRGSMEKVQEYKERFKDRRYIWIKFEDLVINPEEIVRKICKKFNLEYNKQILDYSSFTDKSGDKWEGNSMFNKILNGITPNTIDLWREKLEHWEIWLIESIVDNYMDIFKYKRINLDPTDVMIDDIIQKIKSSNLLIDGVLKFLLKRKGFERFPSDPLQNENWDRGEKEYFKEKNNK